MTMRELFAEILGPKPWVTVWMIVTVLLLMAAAVLALGADELPPATHSGVPPCNGELSGTANTLYKLALALGIVGALSAIGGTIAGETRRNYFLGAVVLSLVVFAVLLGVHLDEHWGPDCRPFN
jgi:hypothetical protein